MCLFAVFASSPHIVSLCGCASGFFLALLSMGSHLVHGLSHPHIHTSSPEFAIDPNINLPPWCSTFSSSPGYSLFLVSFTWWFNPETWKSFIPCQFFITFHHQSSWLENSLGSGDISYICFQPQAMPLFISTVWNCIESYPAFLPLLAPNSCKPFSLENLTAVNLIMSGVLLGIFK